MKVGSDNAGGEKYTLRYSANILDESVMPQNFSFYAGMELVMTLDKDGIIYKGQRIEDGGEAHRAFMEVMGLMREGSDG